MDEDVKRRADARLEDALEARGARDPRDYYRERLRELKGRDADAYGKAVEHYERVLLPAVADDEGDPLEAWQAFGRRLAELTAEGRTVEVDPSGRSHAHDPPASLDRLVLHLPHDTGERALLVSLPLELTRAQRATYDLLVRGKQTLG